MKIKKKSKKQNQPMLSIFPITKSIRYSSRLNPEIIKRQIVNRMLDEILLATNFNLEDQGDGTILMVGRLDTCRVMEDEKNDGQTEA